MRIVVVGAGGLGSYVGAVLARAGHDVTLVARGDHLEALRTDGLHVETVEGDFHVRPSAEAMVHSAGTCLSRLESSLTSPPAASRPTKSVMPCSDGGLPVAMVVGA